LLWPWLVIAQVGRLKSAIPRAPRGRRFATVLSAAVAFWMCSGVVWANTCVWKWSGAPAGSGLFSTAANWSGCGIASPSVADDVVFDKTTSNQNCTVDVAIDVNSITFQNGYSATVAPSGASAIRVHAGITMPSGKLTLTSATTQIGGSFTQTGGTLSANGGTVVLNSTKAVTHSFSQPFNKLIVNDGLVGYWNADEGSGTSLADRSGYANNLRLNTASFATAAPSLTFADPAAIALSGSTFAQLAATPATNLPAANGAETISVWAKLGSTTGTQDMVALGDGGSNGIKLGLNGGALSAWTWGGTSLVSGAAPTDGSWHLVVFTYDGTTNSLYLDGALLNATATAHQVAATTVAYLGTYDGIHELMAGGGALDDVRIYNRALTSTELSGLALGGMPATALATHTLNTAFATTSDLAIISGAVTTTHAVTVGGSWLNYGGSFAGTGTVTLNGASGVILSGGQTMGSALTIGSGSYTLWDRLWVQNRFLTVNGTLNAGAYVTHAGTMSGSGTFGPGTGTVVLDNTQTLSSAAVTSFYNLRLEDPTETNLVGYWKLDQGNGTTLPDVSGSTGNTGTLTGGVTWTSPAPGITFDDATALSFDGTTGYASLGTNNAPAANASQTLSLWAKFPSTGGVHDMVALMNPNGASGLVVGLNGGNLNVSEYGGAVLVSTGAPAINVWHHVAYVYGGSTGSDQLYIDGVLYTGGGNTTTHQTGTPTVAYLGTSNGSIELYQGQLDDVRVYNTALTSAQIGQLAAGRYAGNNGYGTITLSGSLMVNGQLILDASNLAANGNALAASLPSSITTGTYTVGAGSQTFSGGLAVQPSGILTLASGTGSVAIGNGTLLTIDGTLNASANGATIKGVSGHYTFEVGSIATAAPTLNISGLSVQNTDTNGMWINANLGASTTFSRFDNIAFSGGTGADLLQIYAPTLYLPSNGCTFDGSTTYAVKLVGNGTGDGTETRAVFGSATCATNAASGLCAASEKSDDDANNDGIADSPGNGVNFGAVVQFVRAATLENGPSQGFPSAAFDWNTFSYYATYAVSGSTPGSSNSVYVQDESGNTLYTWSTGTNENIVGTPQWITVASTHYLYVATNNISTANAGRVYRLVDNGSSLITDPVWAALPGGDPYNCVCTIKSPLTLDGTNVYWSATSAASTQLLMELGQVAQSVSTGWPLTAPKNVTTSAPELATTGGTSSLYLGITNDLLQLDVTGTTFVANSNLKIVNGWISVGTSLGGITRVYAGDSSGKLWAISPANFAGANFIWSYAAGSAINGSNYYDSTTDTVQFGTSGGTIVVLTGAGSGTSGVVLNSGYPFTLNASDPIVAAPLYYGGVLVVGTTLGKLYFLDRNTGTTPGVGIISEYNFGPTVTVSGVGFDPNVNRYLVSTSSTSGVKNGHLYYFDLVSDPTPTFL
jgi:Concanavalin A-like lectin/glucanases superfamily